MMTPEEYRPYDFNNVTTFMDYMSYFGLFILILLVLLVLYFLIDYSLKAESFKNKDDDAFNDN